MKILALAIALSTATVAAAADDHVSPHIRQNGTFVQGYYKTSENEMRLDNYSTRRNVNPDTGPKGYHTP